jgi:non-specific serine/threonine protein kinase
MVHPAAARLPTADKEWATSLLEYDACRLFVERARVQQPEFALTPHNAFALAQLCERLDGMPLALELAASRLRVLSLEQLCERLQDRFRLLRGGSRTAPSRHQTLRALIDWSYERLEPEEQMLLQRLSVFAGGWTLEAAERVCAGESLQAWEVLDLLTALVDKSLVVYAAGEEESGRYHLLETIRQYARERLAESAEGAALRDRHRDYFLRLAEEADPQLTGPEQGLWLERLEAEHANLRAAMEGDLKAGETGNGEKENTEKENTEKEALSPAAEARLRLAGALWRFWAVRGYLGEGRAYLAEALGRAGAGERTKERAAALNGAGILAWNQGDYGAARASHEESLAIRRELGDKQGIASSLNNLGNVAWNQGDYGTARALYEESLALLRELRHRLGIAHSLNNLGNVAFHQGDYGTAKALQEESLALWRELGDKQGIAGTLNNLGNVARNQGDYGAARASHEESLAIRRELGDKQGIAASLNNLGNVAWNQGVYGTAGALYVESLALWRELGNRQGIAASLEAFARLAGAEGQPERATRLWGAAEALRAAIGSPLPPSEREEYDRQVAAVREAMGKETFAPAWAQGRAMTLEQAIEYTLEKQPLL